MSEDTKDSGVKQMVNPKADFRGGGYQPVEKGFQPRGEERGFQPQSSATPQGQPPQGGTGTVQPSSGGTGTAEKK